jgi:hypothetical protein
VAAAFPSLSSVPVFLISLFSVSGFDMLLMGLDGLVLWRCDGGKSGVGVSEKENGAGESDGSGGWWRQQPPPWRQQWVYMVVFGGEEDEGAVVIEEQELKLFCCFCFLGNFAASVSVFFLCVMLVPVSSSAYV